MESHIKNVEITGFLQENLFPSNSSCEKIFHCIGDLHSTVYKLSPKLVNVTGIKSFNFISIS